MSARIKVVCEGRTEEVFITRVLAPYLEPRQLWVTAFQIPTSPGHRGGAINRDRLCDFLRRKAREDASAWVTTCLDLYGLPSSFTAEISALVDPGQKAVAIEKSISTEVDCANLRVHLAVHEFEAWLFSNPDAFGQWFPDQVPALTAIVAGFPTPEHINDGRETAPSKRLRAIIPRYDKVNDGSLIAQAIGLDGIRSRCPHFHSWVSWLESLP